VFKSLLEFGKLRGIARGEGWPIIGGGRGARTRGYGDIAGRAVEEGG